MGKVTVTSTTSNNVQFYSSTGTMGNYNGNGGSHLCQGPRRVICFCLLAVVTPSLFISTVLLMRFVFNGTAEYHINPSDMRILDHKISTMWCQSETIKMNTTFTAYLASGEPRLTKAPEPLTTTKTLIIPDDHKEYWGFYLLKGSTFRIRTCARHKGATLLIVKGRSHLHHCAYIGQADSAGDSDEFSNSGSLENPADTGRARKIPGSPTSLQHPGQSSHGTSSIEEISAIFSKIRAYIRNRPKGFSKLKENLADWLHIQPNVNTNSTTSASVETKNANSNSPAQSLNNSIANLALNSTSNHPPKNESSIEMEPHHKIRHEHSRHLRHQNSNTINTISLNDKNDDVLSKLHDNLRTRKKRAADSRLHTHRMAIPEHGTIRRSRRNVDVRKATESGENGAFEDSSELGNGEEGQKEFSRLLGLPEIAELENSTVDSNNVSSEVASKLSKENRPDTPNSIWQKEHSHHTGILNDTNSQGLDGSDSESESSFSSSEEALAKCEGVVASLYLSPTELCGVEDYENEHEIPLFYENTVNASGYYYFIFGSENEKRDNFIRARFELEKYVYELPPPIDHCQDVQECQVNLTFFSNQKMVVQIPQPKPEQESIWDEVYIAESQCEPRVLLYLIFVVVVPVSIILCAFQ